MAENGASTDWRNQVPTSLSGAVLLGILTVGLFFAAFGYWALRAPLAGAAIAPGVVIASGQNQEVGHLEGGIISEIAVREGDFVDENQPLIYLDETLVLAERNRVTQQLVFLSARLARARAELVDAEEISFSPELLVRADQINRTDVLDLQRSEFKSRRDQLLSEVAILDEQVLATEEEISGIEEQRRAEQIKKEVLIEDLEAIKSLLDQGLAQKNQYNLLLRNKADTEGAIGRLSATIGQRKKAISEVRERQNALRVARRAEASTLINDTRGQIADLEEQLTSRGDILERMIIRAPVDGVIVKIEKNTIGSVVKPFDPILEILPTSSELIIEARIAPQDVDAVQIGQSANVRFVALNARTTPEVPAIVEYISADRLIDPKNGEPYFDARLKLAEELPEGFDKEQIFPGMPVDTFINTGERTFVEYIAKPVTDSFSKAFREE